MKKFILIALATGHLFEIPTQVVADSRAKHMHEAHLDEFPTLEAAMIDTVEYFEDNFQVEDWAKNNMDTEELIKAARLVRFTPPAINLSDAEWDFEDFPKTIPQIDAASVLQMPVEMALSAMAVHNNICQIVTLNDDKGAVNCAVVLIQGGPQIVGTYVGAMSHLTNTLVAGAQPPAGEVGH